MWKVESARCFARVQNKAQGVEDKVRRQLDEHGKRMEHHKAAEPQPPTGIFARFQPKRHAQYEQDLKAWKAHDKTLHRREKRLNGRVDHVKDFVRESAIPAYPSNGQQAAQQLLRGEQPDLARKLDQVREQERLRQNERLRQETEQRRQRERERGPHRGPEL